MSLRSGTVSRSRHRVSSRYYCEAGERVSLAFFRGKRMTTQLEALTMLAKLKGTTLEHEIAEFNWHMARRIEHEQKRWAKTDEERIARRKASKQRANNQAKAVRAAARGLEPVPSAEELAAKATEIRARRNAYSREYMRKVRAARKGRKVRINNTNDVVA